MIAFEVTVNGVRVGTIGVGDNGYLTATIHWVGTDGVSSEVGMGYGGIDARTDEHVYWPRPPDLNVGDVVSIRIIETDAADPPRARKTLAQIAEEDRALLANAEASHQLRPDEDADQVIVPDQTS